MDKRTHDVEEDLKHILHTRMSLGHKIDLLEKRVEETVQGSKAVALAALDCAKSKAADVIESAAYHMNPTRSPWMMLGGAVAVGVIAGLIEQRRRRAGVYPYYPPQAEGADVMPWPGHEQTDVPPGVYPFYTDQEQLPAPRSGPPDRPLRRTQPSPRSRGWTSDVWRPLLSLWQELADELTQERLRLQGAVMVAGRSFVRDVARIAGEALLDQLNRPGSMSRRHGQP